MAATTIVLSVGARDWTVTVTLIVMSLGTDHHRFDRLVRYVESWLRNGDHDDCQLVLQHGASAPSRLAMRNETSLVPDELRGLYGRADIIVTQVGPGTISDANAVARRPIVVPRNPDHDEVVDRHQYAYGKLMAAAGLVWYATDENQVHTLMNRMASDTTMIRLPAGRPDSNEAAARFSALADDLVIARSARLFSIRRGIEMLR